MASSKLQPKKDTNLTLVVDNSQKNNLSNIDNINHNNAEDRDIKNTDAQDKEISVVEILERIKNNPQYLEKLNLALNLQSNKTSDENKDYNTEYQTHSVVEILEKIQQNNPQYLEKLNLQLNESLKNNIDNQNAIKSQSMIKNAWQKMKKQIWLLKLLLTILQEKSNMKKLLLKV